MSGKKNMGKMSYVHKDQGWFSIKRVIKIDIPLKHYKACSFFVFITFLLVFSYKISVVKAQEMVKQPSTESINNCTPIDLVFVVDQSSEMKYLDPHGMRIASIKWMINLIGYEQILHCPNTTYRVKVIGFNDKKSEYDERLEAINPAIDSTVPWEYWNSQYQALTSSISNENSGDRNFSSLKPAIEEAIETLPNAGSMERKKAIILIIGGGGSWCPDQTCPIYMIQKQQKELSNILGPSDMGSFSFWPITYGGDAKYGSVQFWAQVASDHNGEQHKFEKGSIETGKALKDIFLNINQSASIETQAVCDSFHLDPFLEKVGFNILVENPAKEIKIDSPGNQQNSNILKSVKPNVSLNELYYLYSLPEPGLWKIDADCDNKKALIVAQFVRAKQVSIVEPISSLPQFEGEKLYNIDEPHYLKFRVEDTQGNTIQENPNYKADVTGAVKIPGQQELYMLAFQYKDGLYVSGEALPVSEAGNYQVSITLQISRADPDSSETILISDEVTYNVAPLTPFAIHIESPSSSRQIPVHGNLFDHWLKIKPIEVRVKLASAGNTITSAGQILTGNTKEAVEVILYHPSSGSEEKVWLEPSPTDPLLFIGHVGSEMEYAGEYNIKASFKGQYDTEKYYPQNSDDQRIEFNREDGLFELPIFYFSLISILTFVIMWLTGQEIVKRTNVATGYLLFVPPGNKMKPFAFLDLNEQNKRKVFYNRTKLQERHWLLSNLDTVIVNSPHLIGNVQQIVITEANTEKAFAVDERSDSMPLMTTSKQYLVMYSKNLPSSTPPPGKEAQT